MPNMPSPDELLPDPDELYEHLVDQLSFLQNRGGKISRNKRNFRKTLSTLEEEDPEDWTLDINPNWIVQIETPDYLSRNDSKRDFAIQDGLAVVGGIIKAEENQFKEYSLHLTLIAHRNSEVRGHHAGAPCCWNHGSDEWKFRVAKRYHFDIDVGDDDTEDKPIAHLQSGGNFKKENLPKEIDSDAIHYCSTPLDKPRLPHPPMDPILVLQLVADQYECPSDIRSEYWESQIFEAESMLWERYYSRISEHVSNNDRTDLFDSLISNGRMD
ncbi:hypothetical protein SAMN06264867_106228 [Halorubrum cibi]|uniref:Uncharacterized protein n=2 Tax=Halorubrum cibi TaxID=413815 RepID=A0A521DG40_9EURY|nr:hypothetical protein SAMN06264867_106228 [Halorubrum cibi]